MRKRIIALISGVLLSGLAAGSANAGGFIFSYNSGGDYCREYNQDFYVGNRLQKGYGTACLQPDGSWAIRQPASINMPRPVYARPIAIAPRVVSYPVVYPVTYVERDYHRSYFVPAHRSYREHYYSEGHYYDGRRYGGNNHRDWDGDNHRSNYRHRH